VKIHDWFRPAVPHLPIGSNLAIVSATSSNYLMLSQYTKYRLGLLFISITATGFKSETEEIRSQIFQFLPNRLRLPIANGFLFGNVEIADNRSSACSNNPEM